MEKRMLLRVRDLTFFDLAALKGRAVHFIQQSFKVHSGDSYTLKNPRILKLENGKYLYTIQSY